MSYLMKKSKLPGSGVAFTLSCDLAPFSWDLLVKKEMFDVDTMKVIISLGAKINMRDVKNIISDIKEQSIKILKFATELLQTTPKELLELFQHAVKFSKLKLAEALFKCLPIKEEIDMNLILSSSLRGNAEQRNDYIIFAKKIIELGVNPNGLQHESHSLDVILKMSDDYCKEKTKLLSMLIEHGADIRHCKYTREFQTTLLHIATEFALKSGKTIHIDGPRINFFCSYSMLTKHWCDIAIE